MELLLEQQQQQKMLYISCWKEKIVDIIWPAELRCLRRPSPQFNSSTRLHHASLSPMGHRQATSCFSMDGRRRDTWPEMWGCIVDGASPTWARWSGPSGSTAQVGVDPQGWDAGLKRAQPSLQSSEDNAVQIAFCLPRSTAWVFHWWREIHPLLVRRWINIGQCVNLRNVWFRSHNGSVPASGSV